VRRSTWLGGVDRRKRDGDDTKIDSDLKCQSWYRNTLIAIKRGEMNGCWDLDPIKEGFYKLF
jgi:hypothetical protein